jgi:hypothetical protein
MPGTSAETAPALTAPSKPASTVPPLDPVSAPPVPEGISGRANEVEPASPPAKEDILKQFVDDHRHFSLARYVFFLCPDAPNVDLRSEGTAWQKLPTGGSGHVGKRSVRRSIDFQQRKLPSHV